MSTIAFRDAGMLWLLAGPAALLLIWSWRTACRGIELRRLRARRVIPFRERLAMPGDLLSWLPIIIACGLLVIALARPQAATTLPRRGGVNIVVLQDASASMRVADAGVQERLRATDRWQRSMIFLRELGDALSWTSDRVAMVAFAHIATPQIRLTRDPNTLFFFLDHLYARPPFRVEDDTTWDTNLEEAISWGLRVVDKDEELHGRSANATLFVMLSDGEAWSGEVAAAVARMTARAIPLYVVGVGSLSGGPLPVVRTANGVLIDSPGTSRLERGALQRIAAAGQGNYFELDRDADRAIAHAIVADGRRLAPSAGFEQRAEDLYWWFLLAAASLAAVGLLFVRQRVEAAFLLVGSVITAVLLLPVWR